jgi:hypothetical protein
MTLLAKVRAAVRAYYVAVYDLEQAGCGADWAHARIGCDEPGEFERAELADLEVERAHRRVDLATASVATLLRVAPNVMREAAEAALMELEVNLYAFDFDAADSSLIRETVLQAKALRTETSIIYDSLTRMPIVSGEHDCSKFGCHYHAEDIDDDLGLEPPLYDGNDIAGFRD